MKPLYLLPCLALLCMSVIRLNAQTYDTSTTQGLLKHIFHYIDKSQIPTDVLEEYGAPLVPMQTFNGQLSDSNRIDMNLWRTLYFQTQTGYTGSGTNPLPAITSVNATLKQSVYDTLPVAIPLLIGKYNTVKADAFTNNLLSYNSSQRRIYDVTGRTASPYQLHNLFAACPNRQHTLTGTDSFVIKSNLIWNTSGKTISQVQVDFDNTLGFTTVTIGTPITVSYADTGTKRWTIKVTFSDASVWKCYSEYYVVRAASSNSAARYSSNFVNAFQPFPANANHSGGRVFISYTSLNRTNTMRKPLIVVEGYDVSRIAPNIQRNYGYTQFIDAIDAPGSAYDFNEQLDETAGYDIVFIDFVNGTDDIRRNAALVEEVITWVNGQKVPNGNNSNITEQNVVMGLSMGGLVARYALAEMTKANVATGTRLLITHDAPHRGANVPLGLQYFIRMMGNFQLFGTDVYNIYPQYDEAIGLLNEPATQQLLLYRATGTNNFAANTFLDGDYRTMITFAPTDPQPTYRFIATAQGNECGHAQFSPGKTFFDFGAGVSAGVNARLFFFRIPIVDYRVAVEAEAHALPNFGSTAKIARLYVINNLRLFGFIDIFKQLYNNSAFSSGSQLPVDGVPGSVSPLLDLQAFNQLANLPILQANISITVPLGPIFSAYFNAYAYNAGFSPVFTFVPTASALDVALNTVSLNDEYVNGTNAANPSTSETFIAQETNTAAGITNNVHLQFTPRNSEWLYNEMENLNNSLNCSSECFNNYYIAGSGLVCSSERYFIPGLPRGATVQWQTSPTSIATASPTNQPVTTVTKNADGAFTLTASISGACGTGSYTLTRQLYAGLPPAATGISGFSPTIGVSPGEILELDAYEDDQPFYNWTVAGGTISGNATGKHLTVIVDNPCNGFLVNGYFNIAVSYTNACGTGASWGTNCYIVCGTGADGPMYRMSPNPSSDQLTISSPTKGVKVYEVQVLDKVGSVKRAVRFREGQPSVTINLAGLPADVYYVKIFDGKRWESKPLRKL